MTRAHDSYHAELVAPVLDLANLEAPDLYLANLAAPDLYLANLAAPDLYLANLAAPDLYLANLAAPDLTKALPLDPRREKVACPVAGRGHIHQGSRGPSSCPFV